MEENQYSQYLSSGGGCRMARRVIAESPQMKQILADVTRIAKSKASVFISGESGTGKEVIAYTIHQCSPRASKPFIKVNCAAMPGTLIESEFFGHEKGAFTGANVKHLGRFELADSGSLLLDEVTEIPLTLQAKLLRVVQELEFERVGGTQPVTVDVRLISTTNRDIKDALENRVLRKDLFYRLNVIPVHIPPLRERLEDILPLADYFLEKLCLENHVAKKEITEGAKKKLLAYSWPGNVRELANIIERAVVMDSSKHLEAEHLHLDYGVMMPSKLTLPSGITLQELEKRLIIETLQQHQNNRTKAAEALGISLRSLRTKMLTYQLEKEGSQ